MSQSDIGKRPTEYKYTIRVKTSTSFTAGTDDSARMCIFGKILKLVDMDTPWHDDQQRGEADTYVVRGPGQNWK